MDTEIASKILNTVGLFCDIAGAWLVAWEVVRQYNGKKYLLKNIPSRAMRSSLDPEAEDHPEFVKHELNKYRKMWVGLIFLTFGFLLQISSNWVQFFLPERNKENPKIISDTHMPINPTASQKFNPNPPAIGTIKPENTKPTPDK